MIQGTITQPSDRENGIDGENDSILHYQKQGESCTYFVFVIE